MKKTALGFAIIISFAVQTQHKVAPSKINTGKHRITLFDNDWYFTHDSIGTNKENKSSKWKKIDLPHDWSIEDLPDQKPDSISGPFIRSSIGSTATGYVQGGDAWYKKIFKLNGTSEKLTSLEFDGVYMQCEVFVNGNFAGKHSYGYTPFSIKLNNWLLPAGRYNTIMVLVHNNGKNSRWYSGSGIYRHVWLKITSAAFIVDSSIFIKTIDASSKQASLEINNTVQYSKSDGFEGTMNTMILDSSGKMVGEVQSKFNSRNKEDINSKEKVIITSPHLWSIENPYLYKAVSRLRIKNKIIDSTVTVFGIRTLKWNANEGLVLNGKSIKLRGGCIHHDNGPLGSVALDRAEERKIELLKQNGYNAIRTSHNPPSTSLLNACDQLGIVVIDEAFDMWQRQKNPDDYHLFFVQDWKNDLDAMILRDRNHPSVIMWSIGNEINERADSVGLIIAKGLSNEVRRLDKTRPVTEALCSFWDHPGQKWETTAPAFALLDIGGYNYQWREYENDHVLYPDRIMTGTESVPNEAFENWQQVEKHPYVIGDFVWTAIDYMGETGIGHAILNNRKDSFAMTWPWYISYCGDLDLTGNKKPQSYYRDVVWHQRKIAMAVHRPLPDTLKEVVSYWGWPDELQSWTWNGQEGKLMHVRIFSRSEGVKLLLNNRIIEQKKIPVGSITAEFLVPYEAGTLKAISMDHGLATDSFILKTTGNPSKIILKADRTTIKASGDLSYITAEVTDKDGNVIPDLSITLEFDISGNGKLSGVGSGDPKDMASFASNKRKTFNGRCLAIVKSKNGNGKIFVTAKGKNLKSATIYVKVQ